MSMPGCPSFSARLRSECGVPPLLSFEPTADGNSFHLQRREGDLFRTAERQIHWLLARTSCGEDKDNSTGTPGSNTGSFDIDEPHTVFDVRRIASQLRAVDGSDTGAPKPKDVLEMIKASEDETAHTLRPLMKGQKRLQWDGLIELPIRHAARQTLLLHTNTKPSEGQVDTYLRHHAASTLETIELYLLPDLQKRLADRQMHCTKQRRRLDIMSKTSNEAFEQFDEFCCRTIGVSTDEIPLFPGVDNDNEGLDRILDDYAARIGECALRTMKNELNDQVARFLLLLSDGSDSKCFGEDLMRSLVYFHLYGGFISSLLDEGRDSEEKLSTLERALAGSCDDAFALEFSTCPATRSGLASDLQKLEAFLSSRMHEMTTVSFSRSGREVAESIDFDFVQYCCTAPKADRFQLAEIGLDDVKRLHASVQAVLSNLIGKSSHARRLRFLSDTVGDKDGPGEAFRSTCKKGACLAHRMAVATQGESLAKEAVLKCEAALDCLKSRECAMKRRVKFLRDSSL